MTTKDFRRNTDGYQKAMNTIQEAIRVGAEKLTLNKMELESLPVEISKIKTLRVLNIIGVKLTELPPEIANLTNLCVLKIVDNKLTSLPPEIGKLSNLQFLAVGQNQLRELPPEIGDLIALQELHLNDNQLTKLPAQIGQLVKLYKLDLTKNQLAHLPGNIGNLRKLVELDLYENPIDGLPEEIGNLRKLRYLSLSHSTLKALPRSFGKLTRLVSLSIFGNELESLPKEFGNLRNLEYLTIMGCPIAELPPEFGQLLKLRRLDVTGCQLTTLPRQIGQLKNLEHMDISDNSVTELPPEIGQLSKLESLILGGPIHIWTEQGVAKRKLHNPIRTLPVQIKNLSQLRRLDLKDTLIPVPSEILDTENTQTIFEYYFDILPKLMPVRTAQIFISYSRLDQAQVEEIYQFLLSRGFYPWMDVHNLEAGEIWLDAIYRAIENCRIFVTVLSKNSVDRPGTLERELKAALDKWEAMLPDDIYLIPIKLDDCTIPSRLKKFQTVNWYDKDAKEKILSSIRTSLERRDDEGSFR